MKSLGTRSSNLPLYCFTLVRTGTRGFSVPPYVSTAKHTHSSLFHHHFQNNQTATCHPLRPAWQIIHLSAVKNTFADVKTC